MAKAQNKNNDDAIVVEAIEPNAQPENEADVEPTPAPAPKSGDKQNAKDSREFIVNGQKVDPNGKPL